MERSLPRTQVAILGAADPIIATMTLYFIIQSEKIFEFLYQDKLLKVLWFI